MTTRATNGENYEGPLYAPWSKVVDGRGSTNSEEQSPNPNKGSSGWLERLRKGMEGGRLRLPLPMSKSDVKDFAKTAQRSSRKES